MINSDTILYFPSIEIRDPNWLRAALMIWGNIYRIVPNDYTPDDSDEIKKVTDAGLLTNLRLSKEELAETYDAYSEFMNTLQSVPDGLDAYGRYDRLHVDKIDARLYPILEKLARQVSDGFLEMPAGIARGYMLFLANNAAKRRGINVATDSVDAWVTSSYFSQDGAFSEFVYGPECDDDIRAYSHVDLKDLIPADIYATDISNIINFSKRYEDEKCEFRTVVTEFLNHLSDCKEADHAEYILNKYSTRLHKARSDFKSSSSFLSKTVVRSSLVVGVPVLYTVAGAMSDLFGKENYINYSTSMLIGFAAAMAENRFVSGQTKNSVGNYLLNMDKRLVEHGLSPNYKMHFEEFIND